MGLGIRPGLTPHLSRSLTRTTQDCHPHGAHPAPQPAAMLPPRARAGAGSHPAQLRLAAGGSPGPKGNRPTCACAHQGPVRESPRLCLCTSPHDPQLVLPDCGTERAPVSTAHLRAEGTAALTPAVSNRLYLYLKAEAKPRPPDQEGGGKAGYRSHDIPPPPEGESKGRYRPVRAPCARPASLHAGNQRHPYSIIAKPHLLAPPTGTCQLSKGKDHASPPTCSILSHLRQPWLIRAGLAPPGLGSTQVAGNSSSHAPHPPQPAPGLAPGGAAAQRAAGPAGSVPGLASVWFNPQKHSHAKKQTTETERERDTASKPSWCQAPSPRPSPQRWGWGVMERACPPAPHRQA